MIIRLAPSADEFVRRVSGGLFYLETHPDGVYLVYASNRERACILHPATPTTGSTPAIEAASRLSSRERQVLELLGAGVDMNGIANQLGLSVKTIETYRARIKQKFGIKNRIQLLALAVELRLRHAKASPGDGRTEPVVGGPRLATR
jgi:DNA-binding NarL/FixJ family response regulator